MTIEVKDIQIINRISAHSHINGLGIQEDGVIPHSFEGIVGQIRARKALNLIQRLIKSNRNSGRLVLLVGPPGTGKTALTIGLASSLGGVPVTTLSGCEIYSKETSKTEFIIQALRRSIQIRIREDIRVVEGEVVDINVDRGYNGGKITLKTTDMESVYELGAKMIEQMNKEKVVIGDVISINKDSGKLFKKGKSQSAFKNYDALGPDVQFVPCPEGELIQIREDVQNISLHDMDVINSRTQGYLALFSGLTGEIKPEIREEIDQKVSEWVKEGKAEIIVGITLIDEANMLDIESFSFINKASESPICPIIILATNKEEGKIRGTNEETRYGIPRDLLDRMLIIGTEPYGEEDLRKILEIRMEEEDIKVKEGVMEKLVNIALECGLRYSLNILTISSVRANKRNRPLEVMDVQRVYDLFLDEKRGVAKGEYKN